MVAEPASSELLRIGRHAVRVVAGTLAVAADLGLTAGRATAGIVAGLPHPAPLDSGVRALAERGDAALDLLADTVRAVLRGVVREVLVAFLAEADLTRIVRENVDLDEVAKGIDVDAVVARADLERIVDRLDLDAIVATVDLDRAVRGVDLDAIVDRVDLDRAVGRVDLDGAVRGVDVDAIAARLDLDAVIGRIDLVGLADQVIEGVDLPQIIRDSTGSLSEEAVRGVRSQGMHADDAVAGFVGRLFGRDNPGSSPGAETTDAAAESGDR
ncbi:hypothetical protein [Rhodococcus triatomae]|nr:hypothetical protein G419_19374 [Rhodococcus triatomae BKS 15-14]